MESIEWKINDLVREFGYRNIGDELREKDRSVDIHEGNFISSKK